MTEIDLLRLTQRLLHRRLPSRALTSTPIKAPILPKTLSSTSFSQGDDLNFDEMSFEEIGKALQRRKDSTDSSRPSKNTDPKIVAGIPTGEQASIVRSNHEVLSTHGEEGTPTEDSPRFLSDAEVTLCNSFKTISGKPIRFKHLSLTLPNVEALGITWEKVKSEETFDGIAQGLSSLGRSKKPQLKNVVIVKDTVGGVVVLRIALEVRANNSLSLPAFLKMLYVQIFPKYHRQIQVDSNTSYLKKARELVAPLEAREMDMEPFVFGETFYGLLMRIENDVKDAQRTTAINHIWWKYPRGILRAALEANGSWLVFIGDDEYKKLGAMYPFRTQYAFDMVSTNIIPWLLEPDESDEDRMLRWRLPETSCNDIEREEMAIGIRDVIYGRLTENTKRSPCVPRRNPWDNKRCKPTNGKMQRASDRVL